MSERQDAGTDNCESSMRHSMNGSPDVTSQHTNCFNSQSGYSGWSSGERVRIPSRFQALLQYDLLHGLLQTVLSSFVSHSRRIITQAEFRGRISQISFVVGDLTSADDASLADTNSTACKPPEQGCQSLSNNHIESRSSVSRICSRRRHQD